MAKAVMMIPVNDDRGEMGPKMRALPMRQQVFIMSLLNNGDNNGKRAALDAGYSDGPNGGVAAITAHRILHDTRVQEALAEEATRRMNAATILAVSELVKIAANSGHKNQLKAVEMILNRTGLHAKTEHKVNVTHDMSDDELDTELKRLAVKHGLNLGGLVSTNVIDVEVEGSNEGLEDLL